MKRAGTAAQRYFTFAYENAVKKACSLATLDDRGLVLDLKQGKSMQKRWPKKVAFAMRPGNTVLVDYVASMDGFIVGSPKFQDFIRAQDLSGVEILPIAIVDPKGKQAATDYAIIHPTRVVDCIDQSKSDVQWDDSAKTSLKVKKLVLDDRALGPADRLIRPKFSPGKVIVREDLAKALLEAAFPTVAFSRELFGDYNVVRLI